MAAKKMKKKATKAATRKVLGIKKNKSRKTAVKKARSVRIVKKIRVKKRISKLSKVVKKKKPTMKRSAMKPSLPMPVHEQEVGKVAHYFTHIGVGVVELNGLLEVGDIIHIKGHTTDFVQEVESMQIDRESMQEAHAGQSIGLKVKEHVRQHDVVYKVMK